MFVVSENNSTSCYTSAIYSFFFEMISNCVIPNNDWLNTDRVRTLSRSAFVDDLVHLPKGKNAEHSRASTLD